MIKAESSPPAVLTPLPSGTGSSYSSECNIGGAISISGVIFTALAGIASARDIIWIPGVGGAQLQMIEAIIMSNKISVYFCLNMPDIIYARFKK
jgi:hypothetical protein